MGFEVEIFYETTVHPFFNGGAKREHSLFLFLQETEAGANNLTGVVVAATQDACLYKFLEMRTQCNGCRFHT